MNKTEIKESIFSSTGTLGVSRRQYGRLYANSSYCADLAGVSETFQRLTAVGERHQSKISRSVLRGLVSGDVMQNIFHNGLRQYLEVALPVGEFTDDDSWLVYMARNQSGRELIVPRETMIEKTEIQKQETASPLERARLVIKQGYSFVNLIQADQLDQMHALWSHTFGWSDQELDGLRRRLEANKHKDPTQRDIWFAAIKRNETIVSAAMAERLAIPTACGQLDLVESTEWRTRDEYAGNGLMTAALAALNAQILLDFRGTPHCLPLIFAECNFQSRSDRAGYGVGFRIPSRVYSPQILVQNVLVRDGQPIEAGRLRDFIFMHLPAEIIRKYYDPMQIQEITQLIK